MVVVGQSDIVIELNKLVKVFEVGNQVVNALKGVDLKIRHGQICAITGRSGSGKSTLLHLIGTLDTPTSGHIYLNGQDTSQLSDAGLSRFRNHTIGFVFQMNNLLPEFSALENVMMPGLIAGRDRQETSQKAHELLTAVGLAHREQHRPGELSGGEQQRVAIARSLIMEPPILLADEPTGNLDSGNSSAVIALIQKLCDAKGVTMLLVTHDMNLAKEFPHQIMMEDGMVQQLGGQW